MARFWWCSLGSAFTADLCCYNITPRFILPSQGVEVEGSSFNMLRLRGLRAWEGFNDRVLEVGIIVQHDQ